MAKAIARSQPARIVLLDSSEQNLFEIDSALSSGCSAVPHAAVLGSVADQKLLDHLLDRFRPDIIYHAAAFKHVPLLESNPFAAVANNSLGTYVLALAASRHAVPSFVLISTDKAVHPASVLGASKRAAELATVALSGAECRMNVLRLVNVIGSPGSVVPLFRKQIRAGGPVTVTHPEAARWFLSLEETVQAILAAASATLRGTEGRILIPDPGEPVRIAELAGALMEAEGQIAPIEFTGLRPGDKLTEDLTGVHETRGACVEGSLRVVATRRIDPDTLRHNMEAISRSLAALDREGLMESMRALVPEYTPSEVVS